MAFRVTAPELDGPTVVLGTWAELAAFLRDDLYGGYPEVVINQDPGPITITLVEMTAEEIAALGDFQGY